MNKQQLTDKIRLKYTGRPFGGFREEEPFMIFLGYDSSGWSNIWVEYLGEVRFIALKDVEIAEQL